MDVLTILLAIVVIALIAYIAYLRRERDLINREIDVRAEKRVYGDERSVQG